jgi:P-type E1-E2 ATPase
MVCYSKIDGCDLKYELLNVIEFDSARKRMTVIVRTPENKVMVICKGADSIIEKRLRPGQNEMHQTNKYLEEYANTGLRTLLVVYKFVSNDFYTSWKAKYKNALM